MNNYKDLISKAKKFYENKNFYEAKSELLLALKDQDIDNKLKLSLYILISDICFKLNDFVDAEIYLLEAIKQGKSNSDIYNSLGNIYLKKRDYKNSESSYLKSLNFDKNNEIALINLAILYHNWGRKKEAIFFYNKIIKKNSKNIGALFNLSNIDDKAINENVINTIKSLIQEKKLNNFDLASSFFLLADYERKKNNFRKEISLLENANYFSFKTNEKKNNQLNKYWLDSISKKFNEIEYIKPKKFLVNTRNIFPIFIIGLPRSGSTLIESIISSGTDVIENLGETNLVNWALLNTNKNFLDLLDKNSKIEIRLDQTAQKLINAIENLNIKVSNKKIFFSEKSLENFYYIELILNIFPNAKFIHPYRNIVDNIFAVYKQFLPSISWSHSIKNILKYIDNYLNTIDFFKKKIS